MKNKRLVNAMQNAALLLLTLSALFLLSRTPLLSGRLAASPAAALAPQPTAQPADELNAMLGSVHIMVTADSEYGRYGQLCAGREDPLVQKIIPLLREALGSAAEPEETSQQDFRAALEGTGLYMDFIAPLPLAAVAACLGETVPFDRPVRAVALAAGGETASMYLLEEDGSLSWCATALPVSAVQSICAGVTPNGSFFAYETNYSALKPYTLLAAQVSQPPELQADLPLGYTAYNLLTALDFNAHTNSRYTDWDGAEVVEESPRTLRISPEGMVYYSSAGTAALPLYKAASTALPDALHTAWDLASVLTEGTGASPLYLRGVEETETGYVIRFRYQAEDIPVCFPDESDALAVTISGLSVTGFSYRCRFYTPLEETDSEPLLPPSMAAAIASLRPDSGLTAAYVDAGGTQLSPCWLS